MPGKKPHKIFYKYRSLDNWKFTLDIIVNERLYAAPFKELNDPMEGRYYYFGAAVSKALRKAIYQSKLRRNICSLSGADKSTLLWSYYAAGHTGIAFGVSLPTRRNPALEMCPVRYDNGVFIDAKQAARSSPDSLALAILTQKQLPWQHEKEVRVFTAQSYVPIVLEEIVLGYRISAHDAELITKLARRWHPRIRIRRIAEAALDIPGSA